MKEVRASQVSSLPPHRCVPFGEDRPSLPGSRSYDTSSSKEEPTDTVMVILPILKRMCQCSPGTRCRLCLQTGGTLQLSAAYVGWAQTTEARSRVAAPARAARMCAFRGRPRRTLPKGVSKTAPCITCGGEDHMRAPLVRRLALRRASVGAEAGGARQVRLTRRIHRVLLERIRESYSKLLRVSIDARSLMLGVDKDRLPSVLLRLQQTNAAQFQSLISRQITVLFIRFIFISWV